MEISRNDQNKFFEIWLTNADQKDAACMAQVKALTKQWHAKGYMPVVYKSGREDLYENTSHLLTTNRDRAARRQVEQERATEPEKRPSIREKLRQKPEPAVAKAVAPAKRRDDLAL